MARIMVAASVTRKPGVAGRRQDMREEKRKRTGAVALLWQLLAHACSPSLMHCRAHVVLARSVGFCFGVAGLLLVSH